VTVEKAKAANSLQRGDRVKALHSLNYIKMASVATATVAKERSRKVLAEGSSSSSSSASEMNGDMTVEAFLELQCRKIIEDMKAHSAGLIAKLQAEFKEGSGKIRQLMASDTDTENRICVSLKCIAGAHVGQKFLLEASTESGEDCFKIGRSTGRAFKEKGVSLYKDREISTTHAKIEVRNGLVFLIDAKSTNGTQINGGENIEANVPFRLNVGDIITMGTTELEVGIVLIDDLENSNFASV